MEIVVYVLISLISAALGAFAWTQWKERSGRLEYVIDIMLGFGGELGGIRAFVVDIIDELKRYRESDESFRLEMQDYMKESAKAIRDLRYELSELRGGIFGAETPEDLPPVSMENMEDSFEFDVKSLMDQGFDRSYAEEKAARTVLDKLALFGVGEGVGMVNDAESN